MPIYYIVPQNLPSPLSPMHPTTWSWDALHTFIISFIMDSEETWAHKDRVCIDIKFQGHGLIISSAYGMWNPNDGGEGWF